ncbi:MAG TPA: GNAT family protein [Oleiagrimonas sp.]|nr:GNAT family protein [Oleiagrimonas sp.]
MSEFLQTVTLQGKHVRLEPLSREHAEGLNAAAADGELWSLWYTSVPDRARMDDWIATAIQMRDSGTQQAFAVRDLATGDVVGSTRYCNIDATNRRLEIGHTWYARRVQRSAVNSECKRLLLANAFETLECVAVEFRTHWHNQRSRAAIMRLGAKQDGVLRNHRILPDGSYRDTVVFSIIESEWPAVKRSLDFNLQRNHQA